VDASNLVGMNKRYGAGVALLLFILAAVAAEASETGLSGVQGHPPERFPLALHVAPLGDPALAAVATRVIADWNALLEETLGVRAFKEVERPEAAHVLVTLETGAGQRLMGEARLEADDAGVIALPVRIVVWEPRTRGQTPPEILLYQVLAHELGHALGLTHVREPQSVMCCIHASVDFSDEATREAYVRSRRNPDLRSLRDQLVEHYERFSKGLVPSR
jgi:Matrixin